MKNLEILRNENENAIEVMDLTERFAIYNGPSYKDFPEMKTKKVYNKNDIIFAIKDAVDDNYGFDYNHSEKNNYITVDILGTKVTFRYSKKGIDIWAKIPFDENCELFKVRKQYHKAYTENVDTIDGIIEIIEKFL